MLRKTILIILLAGWQLLQAKPMYCTFHEMMQRSKLIVKGTLTGFEGKDMWSAQNFYLNVTEVWKGQVPLGKLTVKRASGTPYTENGKECIAFINEDGGFEWVATVQTGNIINDGDLLSVHGFYDYNAYLVNPSRITTTQLKSYIQKNTLSGYIYGDLHFFSREKKQMVASPLHLEIDYTYTNGILSEQIRLNGIMLNDFKNTPSFSMPVWDEVVTVTYESNLVRPLEIKGKINGLQTGKEKLRTTFWVYSPGDLSYDEFTTFIQHTEYGYTYYEADVYLNDKKSGVLILGKELGEIGEWKDLENRVWDINEISTDPERRIIVMNGEHEIEIELDKTNITEAQLEYAADDFRRELELGDITITVFKKTESKKTFLGRGYLHFLASKFAPNLNYGK